MQAAAADGGMDSAQQEALAAVRGAVQAVLMGAPGAADKLLRLQAQVAAALVTGQL